MSDSINEQRCERNGLPISGCAASEYDCAKFGVCAAGPSVVTPPAQDEPCEIRLDIDQPTVQTMLAALLACPKAQRMDSMAAVVKLFVERRYEGIWERND